MCLRYSYAGGFGPHRAPVLGGVAALHRLSHSIRPLPMGAGHGSLPGLVSAKERNSLSAVGEFTTPAAQPYLTTTLN
jgi:hypothetical protein